MTADFRVGESPSEAFGKYLKGLRTSKGISQRELAKRVHIDFTYVSKLENDHLPHLPSESLCKAIAIALELDQWEVCLKAGKLPQELQELLLKLPAQELRRLAEREYQGVTE